MRVLNAAALMLILGVGLHIPRSFMLLYGFATITIALAVLDEQASGRQYKHWFQPARLRDTLLLVFFSVAYVAGMLLWKFWTFPADGQDIVNALILPGLMFFVGSRAALLKRVWSTRILLAYSLGGLIYALSALAVSRFPWWNVAQNFAHTLRVAWGNHAEVSVRSVEQTAYPAFLLLVPAVFLLLKAGPSSTRRLGIAFLILSILGAHAVLSLNGRLGWLALALSLVPVIVLVGLGYMSRLTYAWRTAVVLGMFVFMAGGLSRLFLFWAGSVGGEIWDQGLCDERLGLFGAMLTRLHHAPWGGRLLTVAYASCGDNPKNLLLSANGGSVYMVHNVILEIYYSLGWVPVAFLLVVVVVSSLAIGRSFCIAWPMWDWQDVLRWTWVWILVCQWMFQPLLYSDGLLYYFSFFVLGLFAFQGMVGSGLCGRPRLPGSKLSEHMVSQ